MMPHESRSTASRRLAIRLGPDDEEASLTSGPPAVRLRSLTAATTRHLPTVALWTLLLPLLAGALFLAWPKRYEAATRLLVDPRGLSIIERDVTPRSESTDQLVSVVESELRIVTSDTVLKAVVDKLKLTNDPEFNGSERYFWSPVTDVIDDMRAKVRTAMGIDDPAADQNLTALRRLATAVKIERNPQSFIIDLSVRSNNGEKSALIANAITEEYLKTRFSARSNVTERASETIAGRLDELRKSVEVADDNVESYKRENGIIGAGGQLVNEQQLSEVNTQLGNARDEVGRAAARVEQIRAIRANKAAPDAVAEVVNSPTITQLRTLQASIQQRYAAVTADMLPSHPEVKQVRQRLDATRRLINDEIDRIADTAKLDLKRARGTEKDIQKRLAELKKLAQTTNEKIVHLRELEREAEARRSVYTNLLLRSRELDEQKRVDPSLAIVLSPAAPPQRAGGPPMSWILAAAAFAGLGLGIGHAISRDYRDQRIRTPAQSQDLLGVHTTSLPDIGLAASAKTRRKWGHDDDEDDSIVGLSRFAMTDPDLPATLAMKGLASELLTSASKTSSMLLVTSVDQGQAKSTVSLNLALATAELGERVLLIDGDCESQAITGDLGAAPKPGLENLLSQSTADASAVTTPPGLNIDVLTNGQRPQRTASLRNQQMEKAIGNVVASYDTAIVDGGVLPHGRLLPMLVGMAHEVVLVASTGVTEKAALAEAVRLLEAAGVERLRAVLIDA